MKTPRLPRRQRQIEHAAAVNFFGAVVDLGITKLKSGLSEPCAVFKTGEIELDFTVEGGAR